MTCVNQISSACASHTEGKNFQIFYIMTKDEIFCMQNSYIKYCNYIVSVNNLTLKRIRVMSQLSVANVYSYLGRCKIWKFPTEVKSEEARKVQCYD